VAGLNKIKGFSCRVPKGAFYAFPNIRKTGWPSKKLADALLEQAGVACLSGTAFGEYGEGYLRFSVANSLENLNPPRRRTSRPRARPQRPPFPSACSVAPDRGSLP
jgi:aspartate/methionine/tyrosine aminotransferase